MTKEIASKILARLNSITTILNAGTRTTLTDEGNDGGDVCELGHAQIMAVIYGLEDVADHVRIASETPEDREAQEEADDLLNEQESVYWQGLGIR